ncbi:hypothetical protein [Geomesophilobacter sediminis]|uniref:Uncharacterized protein n=1 Tax=Geomesophilobacter sediminis TaxID=2798584 RepID=A0A8J7JMD5_9BACT|nr:hypothetical protein [Geomesophilobacter sediminis]MBJ6725735.1 hypothetical protein [Geomesophilobacter sediminis]
MSHFHSRCDIYRFCIRMQGKSLESVCSSIRYEIATLRGDLSGCRLASEVRRTATRYLQELEVLLDVLLRGMLPLRCTPQFLNSVGPLLNQFPIRISEERAVQVIPVAGPAEGGIDKAMGFLKELAGSTVTARYFFQRIDLKLPAPLSTADQPVPLSKVATLTKGLDRRFPFWLFFVTQQNGTLRQLLQFIARIDSVKGAHGSDRLMELLQEKWLPALNCMCRFAGFAETDIAHLLRQCIEYLFPPRPALRASNRPNRFLAK